MWINNSRVAQFKNTHPSECVRACGKSAYSNEKLTVDSPKYNYNYHVRNTLRLIVLPEMRLADAECCANLCTAQPNEAMREAENKHCARKKHCKPMLDLSGWFFVSNLSCFFPSKQKNMRSTMSYGMHNMDLIWSTETVETFFVAVEPKLLLSAFASTLRVALERSGKKRFATQFSATISDSCSRETQSLPSASA